LKFITQQEMFFSRKQPATGTTPGWLHSHNRPCYSYCINNA